MIAKNTYKVVMLGEGRVGKTSLTTKFCLGQFNENEESTINASFLEKEVEIDGTKKRLAIWDTAGQEKFAAMASIYYRDAEGAVLVYDITIKETFAKVQKWINELKDNAEEDITIVIAGNKSDRENERQIDRAEALQYAKTHGATHFDTSAKSGKGIEEMFAFLAKELHKKKSAKEKKMKIMLKEEKSKHKKSEPCC